MAVVGLVAGCSPAGPEKAVSRLLKLRRERSRDASAYADLVVSAGLAKTLASDAGTGSASPVPEWQTPYLSSEGTSSADVVVVWVPSDRFPSWPKATLFVLEKEGAKWLVNDARDIATSTPQPIRK